MNAESSETTAELKRALAVFSESFAALNGKSGRTGAFL